MNGKPPAFPAGSARLLLVPPVDSRFSMQITYAAYYCDICRPSFHPDLGHARFARF